MSSHLNSPTDDNHSLKSERYEKASVASRDDNGEPLNHAVTAPPRLHVSDPDFQFAPISTTPGLVSRQTSRPRSLTSTKSQRSYAGGDGYTHFKDEEEEDYSEPNDRASVDPEKEFEVKFDGDNDPDSPRSFNFLRKWLIVLINASSSLCV